MISLRECGFLRIRGDAVSCSLDSWFHLSRVLEAVQGRLAPCRGLTESGRLSTQHWRCSGCRSTLVPVAESILLVSEGHRSFESW